MVRFGLGTPRAGDRSGFTGNPEILPHLFLSLAGLPVAWRSTATAVEFPVCAAQKL